MDWNAQDREARRARNMEDEFDSDDDMNEPEAPNATQDNFNGWAVVRRNGDGSGYRTAIAVHSFHARKQPAICVERDNVCFPVAYISTEPRKELFLSALSEFAEIGRAGGALADALARSPYDVAPCSVCGKLVVCLPDGQPCCVTCAEKEGER